MIYCRHAFHCPNGSIRHFLTVDAAKTLVCAFVISKLHYCNSRLSSSPQYILDKLQNVQNVAAKLVMKRCKRDHVQPFLKQLQWLPVRFRIEYKLSTLCFNTFACTSPDYLSELLTVYILARQLSSSADSRSLRIPSTKQRHLGKEHFHILAQHSGMPYRMISATLSQSPALKLC